jgi:hypothetical protein
LPRAGLPRALAVSAVTAAVLAAAWLRLESPLDRPLRAIGVAALALLPVVVPGLSRGRGAVAVRVLAATVAAVLAAWIAFGVSPLHPRHFPGTVGSRFGNGFLDFYDVKTPFDPRVHAEMRGTILGAVFCFALVVSFAVAGRRPPPPSLPFPLCP